MYAWSWHDSRTWTLEHGALQVVFPRRVGYQSEVVITSFQSAVVMQFYSTVQSLGQREISVEAGSINNVPSTWHVVLLSCISAYCDESSNDLRLKVQARSLDNFDTRACYCV
jgi:hypothetical protein